MKGRFIVVLILCLSHFSMTAQNCSDRLLKVKEMYRLSQFASIPDQLVNCIVKLNNSEENLARYLILNAEIHNLVAAGVDSISIVNDDELKNASLSINDNEIDRLIFRPHPYYDVIKGNGTVDLAEEHCAFRVAEIVELWNDLSNNNLNPSNRKIKKDSIRLQKSKRLDSLVAVCYFYCFYSEQDWFELYDTGIDASSFKWDYYAINSGQDSLKQILLEIGVENTLIDRRGGPRTTKVDVGGKSRITQVKTKTQKIQRARAYRALMKYYFQTDEIDLNQRSNRFERFVIGESVIPKGGYTYGYGGDETKRIGFMYGIETSSKSMQLLSKDKALYYRFGFEPMLLFNRFQSSTDDVEIKYNETQLWLTGVGQIEIPLERKKEHRLIIGMRIGILALKGGRLLKVSQNNITNTDQKLRIKNLDLRRNSQWNPWLMIGYRFKNLDFPITFTYNYSLADLRPEGSNVPFVENELGFSLPNTSPHQIAFAFSILEF